MYNADENYKLAKPYYVLINNYTTSLSEIYNYIYCIFFLIG